MSPGSTGSNEYVNLPSSIGSIRAVSLWIYMLPDSQQDDSYNWKYLFDARGGFANSWVAKVSATHAQKGSGISRVVQHNMASGTRTSHTKNFQMPGGEWQHIYIEASSNYSIDDEE